MNKNELIKALKDIKGNDEILIRVDHGKYEPLEIIRPSKVHQFCMFGKMLPYFIQSIPSDQIQYPAILLGNEK